MAETTKIGDSDHAIKLAENLVKQANRLSPGDKTYLFETESCYYFFLKRHNLLDLYPDAWEKAVREHWNHGPSLPKNQTESTLTRTQSGQ